MEKKARKQEKAKKIERHELLDYQVEAARKVVNTLEGRGRDFLAMATGLRKTRVAIETIENVSRRPNKILILADKKDLLEQHKATFSAHFGDEYATSDFTGKKFIQGADRNRKEIVFATRQSMRNYIDEENSQDGSYLSPGFFDFILDDESHHAMAPTYAPTLNYFQPNYLLGMTGTPDRTDWKDIRDIFGEPSVVHTLEEGMRNGWLTPVDYHLVTMIADLEKMEEEIKRQEKIKGKRLTPQEIEQIIFKEKSLEEVIQHMMENVGNRRTAIMCDSIEQSEKVAQILRDVHGEVAEAHHSKSGDDQEHLERFRNNTTQFITSVNKLNEGIDVPEIECVVFLRSTDSKTVFLQQLGRALRHYPGKESALVLDYVGTLNRLEYINNLKKEIGASERDEKEKDINFNKKLHGGKNVFNFDKKIADGISEILKKNERRNEKPKTRAEECVEFSEVETMQFIKDNNIQTKDQYKFWAAGIYDGNKILPKIKKEFGLRNIENKLRVGVGRLHECINTNYAIKNFNYFEQLKKWKIRGFSAHNSGISEYKASIADKWGAMYYIKETLKKPWKYSDMTEKDWVECYGLHLPEAEAEAENCLLEIIEALEKASLLNESFFSVDVLSIFCEDIRWHVHNLYFGNYYDQQRGRDEKVKNASLGPFKGWSVSLNNIIEREKVGHLSLKEAKDFAMENYINTEGLYRFWSAVVFKDNRQLPSYEEFSQIKGFPNLPISKESNVKFTIHKSIEDLDRIGIDEARTSMHEYFETKVINLYGFMYNWKNWNFEARLFGNSLFRLSQEQKDKITSKLLDIANDREASPMMENFGTNKWLESYSIPLPEAEEDAVLCLLNLITTLEKNGLMNEGFLYPEVQDVFIQEVLYQIHLDYYGAMDVYGDDGKPVRAKRGKNKGMVVSPKNGTILLSRKDSV